MNDNIEGMKRTIQSRNCLLLVVRMIGESEMGMSGYVTMCLGMCLGACLELVACLGY